MTLKEKFQNVSWEVLPLSNIQKDECVKIVEEFAIGFYNWMQDNYFQIGDGFVKDLQIDQTKRTIITTEKALEIYKKEKSL